GPAGDAGSSPPALASSASTDVANAFADLERVDFAALRVERVTADVDAARGLRVAAIVSARAPERVRAGRVVRVGLLVRVYRGGLRRLSFPLRIPADARGPIAVAIRGPSVPAAAAPGSPGLSN